MIDGMTAGTVDAPINGGATEKTAPESAGTESVASDGSEEQQDVAGGSQDSAEGSSTQDPQSRRRGTSPFSTIRELRAQLREQRSTYDSRFQEITSRMEDMQRQLQPRGQGQKPSRTFWEAPDEFMEERLKDNITAMEERLAKRWEQNQTQSQQTSEWKSETSEATKFIQGQKVAHEDEEEIAEIIRSTPAMGQMRPMDRAKYALYLWKEAKGINEDKTGLKNRAASVQGASAANTQAKIWTEAEMNREIEKLPANPKDWNEEDKKRFDYLNREFESAHKQGRVKK